MKLPKSIDLLYMPARTYVQASIVRLSNGIIAAEMGEGWWDDPSLDLSMSDSEIDRYWEWSDLRIERDGRMLRSEKLGVLTGDGRVQGAMLISAEPVACECESGKQALFVELLFTAPRNRGWIRKDKSELFRGIGVELLRFGAEMSFARGYAGRIRLDASPNFVAWYEKRGLRKVPIDPIVFEGVIYTPMELETGSVQVLLPERAGGTK